MSSRQRRPGRPDSRAPEAGSGGTLDLGLTAPAPGAAGSGPRPLAEWVPRVLREMGLDAAADGSRLLSAWEHAVGPELAAHSQPQGVRRGVVFATVPDSAWMQRLQMEKVRVLEHLRMALGPDQARDLRLRIAPARRRGEDAD